MTKPTTHRILARNIRPYHWAVWSSTGGEPFANTVCLVKWAEDGMRLVFMLDSHNFIFISPDDYIDVVTSGESEHMLEKYKDWVLPAQPGPPQPTDREQLDQIRALLAAQDIGGDSAVAGVQELIDDRDYWKGKCEEHDRAIAIGHKVFDRVGIPSAAGQSCRHRDCPSHTTHRLYQMEECLLATDRKWGRLAFTTEPNEADRGGRRGAWVMIALRPGRLPDTAADSEAGETWRWLADVDTPGDSPLSRRTVAFMYRHDGQAVIRIRWRADCRITGCSLIFKPMKQRSAMEERVDMHLRAHGFDVVSDPGRTK